MDSIQNTTLSTRARLTTRSASIVAGGVLIAATLCAAAPSAHAHEAPVAAAASVAAKAKPKPTKKHLSYKLTAKTFTGKAQKVKVKKKAKGLGKLTVYYQGVSGTKYKKSKKAPTKAGTYRVSVKIGAGKKFRAATVTLGKFKIRPKPIVIDKSLVGHWSTTSSDTSLNYYYYADGTYSLLILFDGYISDVCVYGRGKWTAKNGVITQTDREVRSSSNAYCASTDAAMILWGPWRPAEPPVSKTYYKISSDEVGRYAYLEDEPIKSDGDYLKLRYRKL